MSDSQRKIIDEEKQRLLEFMKSPIRTEKDGISCRSYSPYPFQSLNDFLYGYANYIPNHVANQARTRRRLDSLAKDGLITRFGCFYTAIGPVPIDKEDTP